MLDTTPIDSFRFAVETEEDKYKNEVLNDFWICCVSREASLLGRREVLTGKAKFGILGDGKEVPQVAMARAFKKGDFRSGYYRDQTLMFALGLATVEDYFAQLYADAENDPWSGGRQMNSHFASPLIDEKGKWLDHTKRYNISSDISATGAQMARSLGLAFASMKYRNNEAFENSSQFSNNGDEVCFCTIGDASTSEGVFWETINAAGVLRVPLAISVWDDGYGISVPKAYQTTKESVSHALQGFQDEGKGSGIDIYTEKGYDYPSLCVLYEKAINKVRTEHIPALIHITDLTQPQGHSTSGSHERYKSKERMEFEKQMDCILHMGEWMVEVGIANQETLDEIKNRAVIFVREGKNRAWKAFRSPVNQELQRVVAIYDRMNASGEMSEEVKALQSDVGKLINPVLSELVDNARKVLFTLSITSNDSATELRDWIAEQENIVNKRYHTHLYAEDYGSALDIEIIDKEYASVSKEMNGYQVINTFFDQKFTEDPRLFAFGEDVGMIGGVNQGFSGLQQKYGRKRIFDTGIREWTIIGQAIGLAMRGWKPIAEIQYLDYIIYGLEPLMDDLATLRYRSAGQQTAPAIIRTRGHRLEGIFHAGSHIGLLVSGLRGMHLICPRDMVQAVGFYNTLLKSEEPGLVIECLNGYRLKERVPENLGDYTLPLGVPEILISGDDVTLVTYGSCVRVAQAALDLLDQHGISVELIDVQTLLPFDLNGVIVESIEKTNKVVFLDEDVPGGATGYMMQQVLDKGGAYSYLDAPPVVISAKAHRTPYGSDGDYFTKPQTTDVFKAVYKMMNEYDPQSYPASF